EHAIVQAPGEPERHRREHGIVGIVREDLRDGAAVLGVVGGVTEQRAVERRAELVAVVGLDTQVGGDVDVHHGTSAVKKPRLYVKAHRASFDGIYADPTPSGLARTPARPGATLPAVSDVLGIDVGATLCKLARSGASLAVEHHASAALAAVRERVLALRPRALGLTGGGATELSKALDGA